MAQQSMRVIIQSNGLGTAGFVVSLISFFCCGLSAPLGLLMSLVALLMPPRGMAFAGVILGGLGSWWLFAFGLATIASVMGTVQTASHADATPVASAPLDASEMDAQPAEPDRMDVPTAPAIAEEPAQALATTPPAEIELPPMPVSKMRTWQSSNGSFSTEAEFLYMANGKVKLRKANGAEITVGLEQLSKADRDWVADRSRSGR